MKRLGNLIGLIAGPDNLRLAFWKAQRGKASSQEIINYRSNLDDNLTLLRNQLLSGTADIGNYHCFTIFDPKERKIVAAPFGQRVLHHAMMNICHNSFERCQLFDSYASRKNKGTYAALQRAHYFSGKYQYFLKLDYRKYFDSINHPVLKQQLKRLYKDPLLLQILNQVIDSYESKPGAGLPIGNLTSQYFANHYLAVADHYAHEKLKCPAYVRYMDDIVIWHNDKKQLLAIAKQFNEFGLTQLYLNLKPICCNKTAAGLPFLSYLVYPGQIKLGRRARVRFIKKMRCYNEKLQNDNWRQTEYRRHVLPLIAFTEHANAKGFRQKVLSKIVGQQS